MQPDAQMVTLNTHSPTQYSWIILNWGGGCRVCLFNLRF